MPDDANVTGPPPRAEVGGRESGDPSRVIATAGATAHAVQLHHRDIPELHADGESPARAAANLAQDLEREIEDVADNLRREVFQRALADVRAFIDGQSTHPEGGTTVDNG